MTAAASMAEILEELAAELDGIEQTRDGESVVYAAGGLAFAVLEGPAASFKLRADVARGALGTPDTAASPRGSDWVRFAPSVLDTFARDRAEAWFRFAHRRATDAGKGSGPIH